MYKLIVIEKYKSILYICFEYLSKKMKKNDKKM